MNWLGSVVCVLPESRLVSVVRRLPQLQVRLSWSLWDVGADCCGWFLNAHCARGVPYHHGGWCLLYGARHSCRHVGCDVVKWWLINAAGASHSVRGWCQPQCRGACHVAVDVGVSRAAPATAAGTFMSL
jgi:hypothetical protein